MAERTDQELVIDYRRGDRSAGEMLFARLARPVKAVCWATCGDDSLAEEAAQETIAKVLGALPRYRADAPLRPWIFQIARHSAIDLLRRRGREKAEPLVEEPSGPPPPDRALLARETADLVAAAVAGLPAPLREAVALKHGAGLDNDEVAKLLGISREALWTRLSRARAELRRRLDDHL